MDNESKYFRLAIPGWIFTALVLGYSFIVNRDVIMKYIIDGKLTESFGPAVITAFIAGIIAAGVPIGYIIDMFYFLTWSLNFNSLISEKIKDVKHFPRPDNWDEMSTVDRYFYIEIIWYQCLIQLEEHQQSYIENRYRYLLNRLHSYAALMWGCFLSVILIMLLGSIFNDKVIAILFTSICLVINHTALRQYKYYERNLNTFQRNMFRFMLNNKKEEHIIIVSR